jgi:hypothetical protein
MATWYKGLIDEFNLAVAGAWPEVGQVIRPEQMGRRNFQRDIEDEALRLPFALIRVGALASATEYAGDRMPLRGTITIWWIDRWEGTGGDQTTDAVGHCADLLSYLRNYSAASLNIEFHRGIRIDGSQESEEALKRLLNVSMPLLAASLSVSVVTGPAN